MSGPLSSKSPLHSHPLRAVVLAAGQGKRLRSEAADCPKVLRKARGRALVDYVLEALSPTVQPENTLLVIGYRWEQVRDAVDPIYPHVLQEQQLGTGHAVACARDWLRTQSGPVLICYGDMPLIRPSTYAGLIQTHLAVPADARQTCTMLTYPTSLDLAYGRILRRADGSFDRVVEDRDCSPEERAIHEYNAGVYVFDSEALLDGLEALKNNNAQGEYYLTDIPGFLRARGDQIGLYATEGPYECLGVNTQQDLDEVSHYLALELHED